MLRTLKELLRHRELLFVLVLREISSRYRQSLLGLGWAFLQAPALTLLVVLVRYFIGRGSGSNSGSDFLDIYARVLPWTFFSNAVLFATPSVVRNGAMLKKIYFPRQIFVASAVLTSLLDFVIGSLPLVGLMIYYGARPTVQLLWVPALLLLEVMLAAAVGLFTGAVAVYKRDVVFGMPFLMTFWMFLSPVFYGLDRVAGLAPRLQSLYMLNPMAGLVESFHSAIMGGAPPLGALGYAAAVTVVLLVICNAVFNALEPRFADVV